MDDFTAAFLFLLAIIIMAAVIMLGLYYLGVGITALCGA